MKPNRRLLSTRVLIGVVVSTAVFAGAIEPTNAQQTDDFPHATQPFQDNALAPADFQTNEFTGRLNLESADSDLTHRVTDAAINLLSGDGNSSWWAKIKSQFGDVDFARVFGSLAIVLGGYLGFVWLTRKFSPRASSGLPQEVVEVLGQSPFGPGKTLQLVRLGSKLLLLMNNKEGTQAVGEITDPHEVEYLISLCGGNKSNRSAVAIRKASHANPPVTNPNSDLKKILRQLQRVTDGPENGSVFEA